MISQQVNIDRERLEVFERAALKNGNHASIEAGSCAMEMVSYLANEPWSDHPKCACPVLTAFVISLNDNWTDAQRQKLKPFLPQLYRLRAAQSWESRRSGASWRLIG